MISSGEKFDKRFAKRYDIETSIEFLKERTKYVIKNFNSRVYQLRQEKQASGKNGLKKLGLGIKQCGIWHLAEYG